NIKTLRTVFALKRICHELLLLTLFLPVSGFVPGQTLAGRNAFIAGLDSIRTSLKIPGMAIAVQADDSLLFAVGLGSADLQNHLPATAKTSFRIASITKTFTSTLIMQLVDDCKLN